MENKEYTELTVEMLEDFLREREETYNIDKIGEESEYPMSKRIRLENDREVNVVFNDRQSHVDFIEQQDKLIKEWVEQNKL